MQRVCCWLFVWRFSLDLQKRAEMPQISKQIYITTSTDRHTKVP